MTSDSSLTSYREKLELLHRGESHSRISKEYFAIQCMLSGDHATLLCADDSKHLFVWLDPLLPALPPYNIRIGKLSIINLDLDLIRLCESSTLLPSRLAGTFLHVLTNDLSIQASVIDLIDDYLCLDSHKPFEDWISDVASLFDSRSPLAAIGLAGEIVFMIRLCRLAPHYIPLWSLSPTCLFDFQQAQPSHSRYIPIEVKSTIFPNSVVLINCTQHARQRSRSKAFLCNTVLVVASDGLNCKELAMELLQCSIQCTDETIYKSLRSKLNSRLSFIGDDFDDLRFEPNSSQCTLYDMMMLPILPLSIHSAITVESYQLDLSQCPAISPEQIQNLLGPG